MAREPQKAIVLSYLKTNGSITVMEAVKELAIMSLPRRIMDLKEDGYNITMTYKKSKNGARYGVYTLEDN